MQIRLTVLLLAAHLSNVHLGAANTSCSYWYALVPSSELNCDPLGVDTTLLCGVYVPHDPPTTVKWYKSESPQNDTGIIAISGNTDGYELRSQLASTPVPSGTFSGLFYDQYVLVITNFTVSDTGYYWCQIETNSTQDSLTSQSPQYAYRAPNPGQSECTSGLQHFEVLDPEVCAVATITSSSTLSSLVTPSPSTHSILDRASQYFSSQASQVLTTLLPTSTPLHPSSDDSDLPTIVYIAVGAGGGGAVVMTCIGAFIVLAICIGLRSKTKREKGGKTSHHTEEENEKQGNLSLEELKAPPALASTTHTSTGMNIAPQAENTYTAVEPASHEYEEITREPQTVTVYSFVGEISKKQSGSKTTQEPEYDQPDVKVQRSADTTLEYSCAYSGGQSGEKGRALSPQQHDYSELEEKPKDS